MQLSLFLNVPNPLNMKSPLLILLCALVVSFELSGQAKTRKLSNSINHPSINLYAPYISADGNALIFISDNAEDGVLTPFYSVREATDWRTPQPIPKNIHTRLSFLWGYALSADGSTAYGSTMKGPGVGGFDIISSTIKGASWAEPVNFGLPINTKANEASPSFTPDGTTMVFMRCETMDQQSASGCKLFIAKKKSNGQWDEPMELPAHINKGNSQSPRILADGETVIFASDKHSPGKGKMDLYLTRKEGSTWSAAQPLEFVNTDQDDLYVSVSSVGRYLLRDTKGPRKNELVEYLIPSDLKPKALMKVEGVVAVSGGSPTSAYISAVDLSNGKRVYNGKANADGSFFFYLKEGSKYQVSIDPEKDSYTYFQKTFDLTKENFPQSEKLSAVLKPLTAGDEISINPAFEENTLTLAEGVKYEFGKIARVINGNPQFNFKLNIVLDGYLEDSLQAAPDLTEVRYDTVVYEYVGIDSLGQTYTEDSLAVEQIYHNDRTEQQAQVIIQQLKQAGVKADKLTYQVTRLPATAPERKVLVKVIVK